MSDNKYLIDIEWLDRVEEVVNYVYNEGAYVIIDMHHEDEWLYLGDPKQEKIAKKVIATLWQQIAIRFQKYDYHLMFETMNEPRLIGTPDEWTSGTVEARNMINELNASAINAIRKTGGYNRERIVLIPTYGAKASKEAIESIVIPQNEEHLILDVHAYVPYEFCMVPETSRNWGTTGEIDCLVKFIKELGLAASTIQIPMIIGEFGAINKNNIEDRSRYLSLYVSEAKKNGIKCIVWDNNNITSFAKESYGLLNRNNNKWVFPEIVKAMIMNS